MYKKHIATELVGPNGSGKSTTFQLLVREIRASSGQVLVPVEGVTQWRRPLIGYCPQEDAIDSLLSARQLLDFYARLHGIDERDRAVRQSLDAVQLCGRNADLPTCQLSGGSRRKVNVAIAVIGRAYFLLLDEPTAGLDRNARQAVTRILRRQSKSEQDRQAVLVTAHNDRIISQRCTRIVTLTATGGFER